MTVGVRPGRAVVVVFAKAPRAGLVKTRMTPPLPAECAAELYSHMLDDVLEATAAIASERDLATLVAVHPPDARWEISQRTPRGYCVVEQRGRDLSERMTWAVNESAAAGASPILLRSSDSPMLSGAIVDEALDALEGADIAISPDLDGGYGLIGLRAPAAGLFDHPMSTRSVLEETRENANRLGLRVELVSVSPDLDTVDDLRELANRRATDGGLCPRTLAYVDERDLWPAGP